jgi:type I restriction enzyme S subunit
MIEWQEWKFSELLVDESISYGIVQPGQHTEINSVPVIRVNNIKNNKIEIDDVLKVSSKIEEKYQRTRLEGGELLITVVGSIGECAIVPSHLKGWNVARAVSVARIKKDFDKRFIKYCFKLDELKFQMYGNTNDTVQPTLNLSSLKNLVLNIPTLPEQKAIAAVLSSLDDKIDLLHRQNKTLEAMAETLFRQWFIEEAEEDWEEIVITDLFEVRDGTHDSPKQTAIGKPLITSKHILTGRLDVENAYLISEIDFEKVNQRSKVETGDILFSMIGTIGLLYLEQSSMVDYTIKNIGLFKTSQNYGWRIYTYLWLKSSIGQQYIDEHKSGSTQEYVSLSSLRSITFRKPPEEKLCEFNKFASKNFSKIYTNQKKIQTLKKLRDNLLPKLMSGEVRVRQND